MSTKKSYKNGKRKNRKIKFSEKNYVEKYYMKGKKAIIPIKLEKLEDLYMKHDFKQMEISDEVCNYIDEIAYMIPIDTDIILEFHCPEFDEETQSKIKKNMKNNYGMEIDANEYDMSTANKRSIVLAIAGLIILVFNVLTENYINSIISNFISVIWWVAIWDMIELQLLDNGESKWKRLNNQQLYDSQVTFVFDGGKEENSKKN